MSTGLSQLLKKSSALLVARIVGGGLAFAANIMIARQFGADALGQFAICMAAAGLIAVLLPAGMQSVGVMFVSGYEARKQFSHAKGFIRTGYRHIAVISLLLLAALTLAAVALGDHVGSQTLITTAFAMLIAPALALINFNCGVLTGFRHQFTGLVPDLLIKPALMFAAIGALGLFLSGPPTVAIMAVVCACIWATALGQTGLMHRQLATLETGPDISHKAAWRKAALPWIPITVMWDYFIELHVLIAGVLVAPDKVGLLHICFRLRVLAAFGVKALSSLIMPDVFATDATGNTAGFTRTLAKINFLTLGYSLGVLGALLVVGETMLGLVDDSFRSGYVMLLAICAAMIPRAVFGPTTAIMALKGFQMPVVWIMALGVVISIGLCLLLYPALGTAAIAIGYLTGSTFICAAQWVWAKRLTGIDCSIFATGNLKRLRRKLRLSPAGAGV